MSLKRKFLLITTLCLIVFGVYMGLLNAQSVIAAASFGQTAQTLNNPTVWQAEVVKLG